MKDRLNEVREKLESMGYTNVYQWCDPPGTFYDWHTHSEDEIRWVYKGSIVIGTQEGVFYLKEGDMLEIPAGTRHWARTEEGVCYLCATKRKNSAKK